MSANSSSLIIPAHGTVFTAPALTMPPENPLTAFNLQADGPAPWKNIGHTSKDNAISFTKEGGDKTTLDTFLANSVRVAKDGVSWGVNINALQMDKATLDLAFGGAFDEDTGGYTIADETTQNVALFLLFQDATASLAFWLPNVDLSAGDAPSVDPSNFFEIPLSASILSAPSDIIPPVNGRAGLFQLFRTGLVAA